MYLTTMLTQCDGDALSGEMYPGFTLYHRPSGIRVTRWDKTSVRGNWQEAVLDLYKILNGEVEL